MTHDDPVADALRERVKELTALHEAARLMHDDALATADMLGAVAAMLPPAMLHTDVAMGLVAHGDLVRTTPEYRATPWMLTAPFTTPDGTAGRLEVAYLEERPVAAEGPFLHEERRLLDSLAEMLGLALRQRQAAADTELLLKLTSAATSELELRDLLPTVSRLLSQHVRHHFISVALWDREAQQLRRHGLVFPQGSKIIKDGDLVPEGAPSQIVYLHGGTRVFRWADIVALGEPVGRLMIDEGLRAACCVPLETSRARHGTLNLGRPDDEDFAAHDVRLLEQIARQVAIAVENAIAYEEISRLKDRAVQEKHYLREELTERTDFNGIIGHSQALTAVLDQVRTVAPTDATVLLLGETGTGKEVLARAIHESSRRSRETFVRVNAAALPAALIESELFGYERGAFTGAVASKVGRIELAHRGTLFLDEVGDLPLDLQPKLLRALQEREFERLGSTRTQKADVRWIAATNRDLEAMVDAGTFRRDLFYRLNVFPIELPPLRTRPEDVPPLVWHFVQTFARQMGRTITSVPAATMQKLREWPWPGNIRELQNVIERAVILSPGPTLQVPASVFQARGRPAAPAAAPAVSYRDSERDIVLRALRDAKGIIGGPQGAAARLGIKRTTLNSKMRKLGIVRPTF